MKIKYIRISNILSFKYFENIDEATIIEVKDDMNILIGQNGAGKSTVFEILNFLFRKGSF